MASSTNWLFGQNELVVCGYSENVLIIVVNDSNLPVSSEQRPAMNFDRTLPGRAGVWCWQLVPFVLHVDPRFPGIASGSGSNNNENHSHLQPFSVGCPRTPCQTLICGVVEADSAVAPYAILGRPATPGAGFPGKRPQEQEIYE